MELRKDHKETTALKTDGDESTGHCYHRDENTNHAGVKTEGRLASLVEPALTKKQ